TAQRELFLPSGPEPEKLEITLAKISAVVGRERVGSPVLLNTHKPDSFQLKKFLVPAAANGSRKSAKNLFAPGAPKGSHEKISYRADRSPLAPGPSPRWGEGNPSQVPPWKRGDHSGVVNSLISLGEEGARKVGEGEAIAPYSSLRRFRPPITARVK